MGQPAPRHSDAAHDAITAELVACTLGQRQRLELRVDMAGKIMQTMREMHERMRRATFRLGGAR